MGCKTQIVHAINGATATTESGWQPVTGASKIGFYFKRSNHNSGSTSFTVEISPDASATNKVVYARLLSNVANDNTEEETRVAAVALTNNGVAYASMDANDTVGWVRVVATETTDGTHDAWIVINYD